MIQRSHRDLDAVFNSLSATADAVPTVLVLGWLLGRISKGPGTFEPRELDQLGVATEFLVLSDRLKVDLSNGPLEVAVRVFAWSLGYTDELPDVIVDGLL